jgi:penicillin-binding protein, 1A family
MTSITRFGHFTMKISFRILRYCVISALALVLLGTGTLGVIYLWVAPRLPSIESLKDVRLKVPLRVYTREGELIAEFGEMRRTPLVYDQIPDLMVEAFIAAEDDRFFQHPGVDPLGLARATWFLLKTGDKGQGGSTITMQVARNFFLSGEKTFLRKLSEIFLALKIERELSKQEIMELYLNKIYLGNRAYGVAAAAQVYYGTAVDNLTVAQMAMIAGLPKAPSRYNPIADRERALARRAYVLGRMYARGMLTEPEYQQAMAETNTATLHSLAVAVEAPYVAEMVRAKVVERFGQEAYSEGLRVVTTIDERLQAAANQALRNALLAYDRRHGYRGAEAHLDLTREDNAPVWDALLADYASVGGLQPGLVVGLDARRARVYVRHGQTIELGWEGLAWARSFVTDHSRGPEPKQASDILKVGDVVRVMPNEGGTWRLTQIPSVEGALVALSSKDGAILALLGGFDFYRSKFNRATQALRQPGSSFKPFIYSAALEKGFTLASIINDAPIVFGDPALESTWRPENYGGGFRGPTRLREALVHSRNLVSIRLLRAIGVPYAINFIERFGFDKERLPRDLSLALGSGSVTALELAVGYAVFANGGFRVEPYFIDRIEDVQGKVVYRAEQPTACAECIEPGVRDKEREPKQLGAGVMETEREELTHLAPRVLSPQNAYMMTSMMEDAIRRGTGRAALSLGRTDLAGKTGTTNEQRDAWFSGFSRDVVATAWVGFDQLHSLGDQETGARAALPAWIDFMRVTLEGVPERALEPPSGVVTVRIDPETGTAAAADNSPAIFEIFRAENVPQRTQDARSAAQEDSSPTFGESPEQLF